MTEDTFDQMQADFFEDDDEVGQPQAKSSSTGSVLTPSMRAHAEDMVERGIINTALEDEAEEDYRRLSNVPQAASTTEGGPKFRFSMSSRLQEEDEDDPEALANSGFKVTVPQASPSVSSSQEVAQPPKVVAQPTPTVSSTPKKPAASAAKTEVAPPKAATVAEKNDSEVSVSKTVERLAKRKNASRFRLLEADLAVLNFTNVARYATYSQFAKLLGASDGSAKNRANRLVDYGYLRKKVFTGTPALYSLTELGQSEVDYDLALPGDNFSERLIKHTLATNEVMIALLKSGLGMFPKDEIDLDALLPEHLLKGAVYSKKQEFDDKPYEKEGFARMQTEKQLAYARYSADTSKTPPEFDFEGDWKFLLFGMFGGDTYHFPDLVLKRPRDENGYPQSVAFEIELSKKTDSVLGRIMRGFKQEFEQETRAVYGGLVYVVGSQRVADHVLQAVHRQGIDADDFRLLTLDQVKDWQS